MSRVFLGRALAIAGIVTGLLAVGLPFASGSRYLADGTATAFLVVLIAFSSWLPAEIGKDLLAGAAGAAAFGFYLVLPATAAFDSLGYLDAGGWLGLCTVLIPIGSLVIGGAGRSAAAGRSGRAFPGMLLSPTVALGLIVAGVWLDVGRGGPSYWNVSSSGHALGLLLLVLVALNLALLADSARRSPAAGDLAVLVAAATFGVAGFACVSAAFENLGSLGAGAWIEFCGGTLLLGSVALSRLARPRRAVAPAAVS